MIIIPVAPVPKPRMTKSDRWKKRECVQKYWQWKDRIRSYIQVLPAEFKVIFEVEMPQSWSEKKKKQKLGTPHQSRPDIDNFLKALMDAIETEDGFVCSVEMKKIWGRTGRITIEQL